MYMCIQFCLRSTNRHFLSDGLDLNLTLTASTLTFAPDDVLVDFEFRVFVDELFEAPESVTLFLEPEAGESAVEVLGSALVTILDSDSETIVVVGVVVA